MSGTVTVGSVTLNWTDTVDIDEYSTRKIPRPDWNVNRIVTSLEVDTGVEVYSSVRIDMKDIEERLSFTFTLAEIVYALPELVESMGKWDGKNYHFKHDVDGREAQFEDYYYHGNSRTFEVERDGRGLILKSPDLIEVLRRYFEHFTVYSTK